MMLKAEIMRLDVVTKSAEYVRDFVAKEKPFHLFLNRVFYATIFCSPLNLKELALGHLITGAIVKSIDEIEAIDVKEDTCRVRLISDIDLEKRLRLSKHYERVIVSACGSRGAYSPPPKLSKIISDLKVKADVVVDCVRHLNRAATIFRKTGGVHAAAISDQNGVPLAFCEDVGRHNAVDKTIGVAVMNRVDLGTCVLALTGRLTGDIVMKSVAVGLPIVASIAAAIDSGIALARKVDLTLIGFVRGERMNIYSCPERILS